MKPRLLVIFSSLPEVGGHTTTTLKLCEVLRPVFQEVHVIAKDIPGHGFSTAARDELEGRKIEVFRISGSNPAGGLRALSLSRKPDVFLAIGMRHLSPVFALLLAARQSVYYHITHELSPLILRQLRIYSLFFNKLVFLSPVTAKVFASSAGLPEPSAWAVQPTGLPFDPVLLAVPEHRAVRFGLLGRLTEEKGVGLLATLVEKSPEPCELHIAGRGPKEADLQTLQGRHPDRFFLRGSYTPAERGAYLQGFFSEIDFLCVPSLDDREGIPNVILEALQFGVPILATNTGGMRSFAMAELGPAEPDVIRLVEPADFPSAFSSVLRGPLPSMAARVRCKDYFERYFSDRVLSVHWLRILSIFER